MPASHVVPARPAPLGQPRPARRRRRDGDVLPLFVLDPALWRPSGPVAAALPGGVAARPGLPHRADHPSAGPGAPRSSAPRARSGPTGCTSPPTSVRTAAPATSEVDAALAEHDIELVRTGSSYAVAPGRVTKGDGDAVPGLHAVLRGRGRSTAGATRSAPRGPAAGSARRRRRRARRAELPDGLTLPRGRRGGRPPALADYRRRAARGLRPPTATAPTSTHLAHVGAPQVGRDPPAHDAGRPARAHRRGRGDVPQGARLARVLRRRALPPARSPRATTSGRSSSGWRTTTRATSSTPGARAAPATRSSTPACASCARPGGCTTGCG